MTGETSKPPYTFVGDLKALINDIPSDSIISRTIYKDAHYKAVLFGFDAGQYLSEHSAAQAATIHIVSGQAIITLGDQTHAAQEGTWLHMPPRLVHSVTAITPLIMLLLMMDAGNTDGNA